MFGFTEDDWVSESSPILETSFVFQKLTARSVIDQLVDSVLSQLLGPHCNLSLQELDFFLRLLG